MKASKPSISLIQQKLSVCVQSSCRLLARVPRPTALTGLLCAVPIQPSPPQLPPLGGGPILGPEVSFRVPRFAPGFTPSPARPSAAAIYHVCRPSPRERLTERPRGLPATPTRPGRLQAPRQRGKRRAGRCRAGPGRAVPCRAVPARPALRYPPRGEEHDEVRGGGGAVPQHLGAVEVPRVRVRLRLLARLRLGPHRPSAKHGAERGPGEQAAPGRAGAQRSHGSDEAASGGKPQAAAASLPALPPASPPAASPRPLCRPPRSPTPQPFAPTAG